MGSQKFNNDLKNVSTFRQGLKIESPRWAEIHTTLLTLRPCTAADSSKSSGVTAAARARNPWATWPRATPQRLVLCVRRSEGRAGAAGALSASAASSSSSNSSRRSCSVRALLWTWGPQTLTHSEHNRK